MLSPAAAAEILGVSVRTIQRWDKAGKLRCVRTPGDRRRIPMSEVQRILDGEHNPQPREG